MAQRHGHLAKTKAEDTQNSLNQGPQSGSSSNIRVDNAEPKTTSERPENSRKDGGDERVYNVKVVDEDWHYWVPVGVNASLAFIGFVTAVAVVSQARSNQIAADAALKSAEAVIGSQRAWVMVELDNYNPQKPIYGPAINTDLKSIVLCIRNVGPTPARLTFVSFRCILTNDVNALPVEPEYSEPVRQTDLLVPEDFFQLIVQLENPAGHSSEELNLLALNDWAIYTFGYVKYTDVFGKDRTTRVGFKLETFQVALSRRRRIIQAGPDAYNQAT